jgi:hypothetical protein
VSDTPGFVLSGRLELPQAAAVPGDALEYIVVNTGEVPIMLGAAYVLEHQASSGEWHAVEPRARFRAWGRVLSPGARCQLTARLPATLSAGSYRLRKILRAHTDPGPNQGARASLVPVEATAAFTVVAS